MPHGIDPADAVQRPEGREGLVMVYDHNNRYLGCMGTETWQEMLRKEVESLVGNRPRSRPRMTARAFEVSFTTGPLDDREVDALADILWELGFDALCFRPLATLSPPGGWPRKTRPDHHSRADTTADRDALRAADQHELAREMKW